VSISKRRHLKTWFENFLCRDARFTCGCFLINITEARQQWGIVLKKGQRQTFFTWDFWSIQTCSASISQVPFNCN